MTCKEALNARYSVLGKRPNGISQYAPCLNFFEAQRFFNSLIKQGYKAQAKPLTLTIC